MNHWIEDGKGKHLSMGNTTIEWTNKTWNPVTGCTKVSPGCRHCYAETVARRFPARFYADGQFVPWTVKAQREEAKRLTNLASELGTPFEPSDYSPVMLHPERLQDPLRWRKPSQVFVNSMSDLLHEDVPLEFIRQVFAVMAQARWHTFQVLTKRHKRLESLADILDWPPNMWMGVSVENQRYAEERIPALLRTPAAVHFVSCEPLLSGLDLRPYLIPQCQECREAGCYKCDCDDCADGAALDWVIVGGESGPKARPMNPEWILSLRNQCRTAGVAFFLKQLGSVLAKRWRLKDSKGADWNEWPAALRVREMPSNQENSHEH